MSNMEELKTLVKEFVLREGGAPNFWCSIEILETLNLSSADLDQAVEEVGLELEQQGYTLLWHFTAPEDAGAVRFEVVK